MEQLTLQEAIEILEITDLDSLTENDLAKVKKKASKKWHPDRVAAMNPDEEVINAYKANFQKIAPAIEIIRAYINGEDYTDMSANANINRESSVDILKKEFPNIQEFFTRNWAAIKATDYKKTIEKVLIFEGFSVPEILKRDLEYEIPEVAIVAMLSGTILPTIVGLFFVGIPPIALLIYLFVAVQVLCSAIALFPTGRFWLPQFMQNIVLQVLDIGVYMHNAVGFLSDLLPNRFRWIIHLFLKSIQFFGRIAQKLIVAPIYYIVGSIFQDKRIGKVEKELIFYGGFTADYVDELLAMPLDNLSEEQVYHVGSMYNALGDFQAVST